MPAYEKSLQPWRESLLTEKKRKVMSLTPVAPIITGEFRLAVEEKRLSLLLWGASDLDAPRTQIVLTDERLGEEQILGLSLYAPRKALVWSAKSLYTVDLEPALLQPRKQLYSGDVAAGGRPTEYPVCRFATSDLLPAGERVQRCATEVGSNSGAVQGNKGAIYPLNLETMTVGPVLPSLTMGFDAAGIEGLVCHGGKILAVAVHPTSQQMQVSRCDGRWSTLLRRGADNGRVADHCLTNLGEGGWGLVRRESGLVRAERYDWEAGREPNGLMKPAWACTFPETDQVHGLQMHLAPKGEVAVVAWVAFYRDPAVGFASVSAAHVRLVDNQTGAEVENADGRHLVLFDGGNPSPLDWRMIPASPCGYPERRNITSAWHASLPSGEFVTLGQAYGNAASDLSGPMHTVMLSLPKAFDQDGIPTLMDVLPPRLLALQKQQAKQSAQGWSLEL